MATSGVYTIQALIARYDHAHNEWHFLVLRRAPDETIYPSVWQVITGSIDEGETAIETAFREIREETGIVADELWVVPFVGSFFDARRDVVHLVPCFAAIVESDAVTLSIEHSEYRWLSLAEACALIDFPSQQQGLKTLHRHILSNREQAIFPRFSPPPLK